MAIQLMRISGRLVSLILRKSDNFGALYLLDEAGLDVAERRQPSMNKRNLKSAIRDA
jgi:hypothetical protein